MSTDADGFPIASLENEGTLYTDEWEVVWVCEWEPALGQYVWRSIGPLNPAPKEE